VKVCVPVAQKPKAVPAGEIDATLFAVAVNAAEITPPAAADGLTCVVQLVPLASVVEPLLQVPPSKPKFVVLDSVRLNAEDV
jgi:hypothetical protein